MCSASTLRASVPKLAAHHVHGAERFQVFGWHVVFQAAEALGFELGEFVAHRGVIEVAVGPDPVAAGLGLVRRLQKHPAEFGRGDRTGHG